MPRCPGCPIAGEARSPCDPARDWPGWCGRIAGEDHQPEHARYWSRRIFDEADKLSKAGPVSRAARRTSFPPRRPPDGRLRVGVLSPCCGLGGADIWVGDLMARTDHARVRWEGVAIRGNSGVPVSAEVRAMWEATAPLGIGDAAIRELASRCDILVAWGLGHRWGFATDETAPLVGRTPILQVSHGAEGFHLDKDLGPLNVVGSAVVSEAAVRGLPEAFRGAYSIMPNLVDPARVATTRTVAETRVSLGVPDGVKIAGWLARMSDEKRPEVFIRACALLPDGWIGVMAGTGWRDAETRDLIDEVAHGKVLMVGPRHDVGDVLAAYDVLCMPSRSEAASLSASEAWLSGTPLISCKVGSLETYPHLARIIPNPPTGEELAGAILADEADKDGTAARVEVARTFAVENLSPARFGARWTDWIVGLAPAPVAKVVTVAAPARPAIDPAVRDAVNSCPDRGSVLPVSQQPEGCGCRGDAWSCRKGKGRTPGKAFLADCLACKTAELSLTTPRPA